MGSKRVFVGLLSLEFSRFRLFADFAFNQALPFGS